MSKNFGSVGRSSGVQNIGNGTCGRGQGNAGGWPSGSGNKSSGGRGNNLPRSK
jgi:hypothetical protein